MVKKRKVTPAIAAEPTVVEAFALPISEQSNRVLVGKLDINKRFPKGYMSSEPIKEPPLANMTLSSIWKAVRTIITY